jgi:replicative superfamily II helicase
MPIDFSDMIDDDDDGVINPRDIFFTLNRKPTFSFPRDIQTEVLNQWFETKDENDSVLKLNVGSGKTLVGLLILQSCLNEGVGPALYVCPDKQLTRQVINEAKALGIDVTDNPKSPSYAAGEAICVINVYKLFNGRSVFGVGSQKIEIGSLIVDDAHACVSTITEQFRISLPNSNSAYQEILKELKEDLKGYNAARFMDIEASDPAAYMEVPFWSWNSKLDAILSILHRHREEDELQFTFPLLSEILSQCRCVVGGQYLEIEPYFPATDLVQSFRRAKRRVYMTATLADDSPIVTHFGAKASKLKEPIVPNSSQSMGERMILMPQELNPDLDANDIQDLLKRLSKSENVVVIVPSSAAAEEWSSCADQILIGDDVDSGVDKLRKSHVGLTVLVNRYDGIDLPGNACRVLVISELPEVSSYSEILDSEVLSNTQVNLRRQIERIEQGMGRGVRSNEDYCAVLLLGSKLISRLRSKEGQNLLTPATKAQLELSRKIARKLSSPDINEIGFVIKQCLDRDEGWIKVSKKILVNLDPDDQIRLDSAKLAIRQAFDDARMNQHNEALKVLDTEIDKSEEESVKAWLLSRKASFQHAVDAGGAQKTLLAAHRMEPSVLKPMAGANYKHLQATTEQQAAQIIRNHSERFIDHVQMLLFKDALCSDLRFLPETSDKFEAAINDLAMFIGIAGQRPEKDFKEGPDNLWALNDGTFIVIECKNGVTATGGISKKDAGQLGQSMEWFSSKYSSSEAAPVIIHPEKRLGQGASSVSEMRVIDDKCLERLKAKLKAFSQEIANPEVASSAPEIAKRLAQYDLLAQSFINVFSVPVKK